MGKLSELADKVEALDGPDREVDAEIALAIGLDIGRSRGALNDCRVPAFTASLDAAMMLADSDAMAIGILQDAIERLEDNGRPKGEWAKQLPRYVTAAALRAKDAQDGQ